MISRAKGRSRKKFKSAKLALTFTSVAQMKSAFLNKDRERSMEWFSIRQAPVAPQVHDKVVSRGLAPVGVEMIQEEQGADGSLLLAARLKTQTWKALR